MDDDAKVGYRNPPKHSRWKKGQSGNPKGRPKSRADLLQEASAILSEPVTGRTADGKSISLAGLEAAYLALCRKGLKDDVPALLTAINIMLEVQPAIDKQVEHELRFKGAKEKLRQMLAPHVEAHPTRALDED